jgi:glycosyltransferase involved in cell wall biosynthesis
MKIFFYSTVFSPSVGGIETLTETLCRQFVTLGHEVKLATETPGDRAFPFDVIRKPDVKRFRELLKWADVHVQANVSLKASWVWFFAPRKTLYQHNNVYQRDDGSKRPVDRLKTALSRVTPSIANSSYTAERTGAKYVILNAYDDTTFTAAPKWSEKDRDLVFLGRLVSQKGCHTLIDALAGLIAKGGRTNLTVIGDGPERAHLEHQAIEAGVADHVRFLNGLRGEALASELARHRVIVVPSSYEEPFGIVALEGLASGCIPIVSERGGLVDAISGHGFTFANGDARALEGCLESVLADISGARTRLRDVQKHLDHCSGRAVAMSYIRAFKQHLARHP